MGNWDNKIPRHSRRIQNNCKDWQSGCTADVLQILFSSYRPFVFISYLSDNSLCIGIVNYILLQTNKTEQVHHWALEMLAAIFYNNYNNKTSNLYSVFLDTQRYFLDGARLAFYPLFQTNCFQPIFSLKVKVLKLTNKHHNTVSPALSSFQLNWPKPLLKPHQGFPVAYAHANVEKPEWLILCFFPILSQLNHIFVVILAACATL